MVALLALALGPLPALAASVTLSWTADATAGLVGYRLHYGMASRKYTHHVLVRATATSATAPGLQAGRTYYFAVTATNAAGLESAYSAEVAYTVPAEPLPLVSVVAGTNACEPSRLGSFLFTRTGDVTKALRVNFTLAGEAQPGVDYKSPGTKLVFRPGRTNAVLWIRPIADRVFEGAKPLELSLSNAPSYDVSDLDSAALLVGDDDRPQLGIRASRPAVTGAWQTEIHADAYAGFSTLLQTSTNLVNWSVIAASSLAQPVDYSDSNPTGARTRFYRAVYVRGEVTEASIAEALRYQLFSANIVGSVNVPLAPGWNLVANPLNGAATQGPLGDVPTGTIFVPFGRTRMNTFADGQWNRGVPLTRFAMGGWLYNPSNASVNLCFVGEVPTPTRKPAIPAGWSVRSSSVDLTVNDAELLGYPLERGDAVYEFNPLAVGAEVWLAHVRGTNAWDAPPRLTAGQAVLIYKTKSTRAPDVAPPTPAMPEFIRLVPVAGD